MARTDSFRTQHQQLLEIVQQIAAKLNPNSLPSNADEVRKALTQLSGRLEFHLAMEDKHLYPLMAKSSNAQGVQMADRFAKEMGQLAGVFSSYVKQWPTADAIKKDPNGFCTQTQSVFKALADRVQREEGQLYPLADQI